MRYQFELPFLLHPLLTLFPAKVASFFLSDGKRALCVSEEVSVKSSVEREGKSGGEQVAKAFFPEDPENKRRYEYTRVPSLSDSPKRK